MLENIFSHRAIEAIGWTLLHFIWQGAVIAVLLATALKLLRKASANVRYAAACSAFVLFVVSAVVTMYIAAPANVNVPIHAEIAEPASEPPAAAVVEEVPGPSKALTAKPAQIATEAPSVSWKERIVASAKKLLPHIVFFWTVGVLLLSVWHLGGWAQLQRLRRRMIKPVSDAVQANAKRLAELIGVRRVFELTESALVQVPTVVGWLKPLILLPASALTGLSGEQLEAILAHELAHIRRYDYLVNMFQTVIEIVGFYHPAVWWVSHRIRVERENCCDDIAVRVSGDGVGYAKALTAIEELRSSGHRLAVAASGGSLFDRVRRLVGSDFRQQNRSGRAPALIAVLLVLALAVPVTIALTSEPNKIPEGLGSTVIKGIRANREKFECGALAWSGKTVNDRFRYYDSNEPAKVLTGQYELWWDDEKIASKYVHDQLTRDPTGHFRVEKQQGGNSYDGSLMSRKPRFDYYENWLRVTGWRGEGARDKIILLMNKIEHVTKDWSVVDVNGIKLIKFTVRNMNEGDQDFNGYSVWFYDQSKGYGLVSKESYNPNGSPRVKHTLKLKEVIPGGWFPVEVDYKSYAIPDGKVYVHQQYKLDIDRCSFNDRPALPEGIFTWALKKQLEQQERHTRKLQKYLAMELEGISVVEEIDETDSVKRGAREAIEAFLTAAVAGDFEKAKEYAHPKRLPADHINDIHEAVEGQKLWIMAVVADDSSAIAVSSVIRGDHDRVGPLVFHMDRVVQDGNDNWWIHDIDMVTPDRAEEDLKKFVEKHPEAKRVPELPLSEPVEGEGRIQKGFYSRIDREIGELKGKYPQLADWDKKKTDTRWFGTGKEITGGGLTYNHAVSGKHSAGHKDWCGKNGLHMWIKPYTSLEGPYIKTSIYPLNKRESVLARVITGNPEAPELEKKINDIIQTAAIFAMQEADGEDTWGQAENATRQRYFVTIVVGRDEMTFEGQAVTWEQLPGLLEKVPDPNHTVLTLAVASDETTLAEKNHAVGRASALQKQFGFESFSYVGVHPLGSNGEPSHHILEGKLQFDKELPVQLQAGTQKEPGLIKCEWIRFEKSQGLVKAKLHANVLSWPKAKWEFRVLLRDSKNRPLKHDSVLFENSGRIVGYPMWGQEEFEFVLGAENELSDAVGFELRIRDLRDSPKMSGSPVKETGVEIGGEIKEVTLKPVAMTNTGRALDIAIDGHGYFKVISSGGNEYYTRCGNFGLSPNGEIILMEPYGLMLEPSVTVHPLYEKIDVSSNGRITVTTGVDSSSDIGQIPLYRFMNPEKLNYIGRNLFIQTDASGSANYGMAGEDGFGRLVQGSLESSSPSSDKPTLKTNYHISHIRPQDFTGRSLDITILGKGLFGLDLGNDKRAFTRYGNFYLNRNAEIVWGNPNGPLLTPTITLPGGYDKVNISYDGRVLVDVSGQTLDVGIIMLYGVSHKDSLRSDQGEYLYYPTKASGEIFQNDPASNDFGILQPGFLEKPSASTHQSNFKQVLLKSAIVTPTGRSLDIAISGAGFFQISLPNGMTRFTRYGALQVNPKRELVTSSGFLITPSVSIPGGWDAITIERDGSIVTTDSTGAQLTVGNLQLARFPNPSGLIADGDKLLVETELSGPAILGRPGENYLGIIRSGFLESSSPPSVIGVNGKKQKLKIAKILRIEFNEDSGEAQDESESEHSVSLGIPLASLKSGNRKLPGIAQKMMKHYGITIEDVIKMLEDGVEPMVLLDSEEKSQEKSSESNFHIRISLE